MKYFTMEIWAKLNHSNPEELPEVEREWYRNCEEYNRIFENLKPRFPKSFVIEYENNDGFHDSRLKAINLIHREKKYDDTLWLELDIQNWKGTYQIQYQGITKYQINYEKSQDSRGFGDWGYDEFLPVSEKITSHEILFVYGASILVHFSRIILKKTDCRDEIPSPMTKEV